jgi:hypothetical protein
MSDLKEDWMRNLVRRPSTMRRPGASVLLEDHFQVAYTTNDIDRCLQVVKERYGLQNFHRVEGEMPTGGYLRGAFGWAGPVMYEFIQADGPGGAFYNKRLPLGGFAIRHHHLGYLVESQARWDALQERIARENWKVVFDMRQEGLMRATYIEAPEFEHYLEYIFPEPAGIEFFEGLPNN